MVITDITSSEKRKFEKYQKEGMLPSQALRRIETERRLGIVDEDKGFFESLFNEDTAFKVGLGAVGIAILYIYIKARTSSTTQTVSMSNPRTTTVTFTNY